MINISLKVLAINKFKYIKSLFLLFGQIFYNEKRQITVIRDMGRGRLHYAQVFKVTLVVYLREELIRIN